MKKLRFLIILAFCLYGFTAVFTQTTLTNAYGEVKTFSYELLVEAPVFECDILGNRLDSLVRVAPKDAVFESIDTIGSSHIIRFWLWKKDDYRLNTLNYTDSTRTERKYFLLSTDEFNKKAIPRFNKTPSFTIGVTTIPLRIRTSPFDFSGEFSFGTNFGIKFPISNYQNNSINLVAGIHLTHISLDSLNTVETNKSSVGQKPSALTFTVGCVFEFSKAQLGVYLGWDYLSGLNKDIWIYQGKPWLSVGVGTSLFNTSSSALTRNGGG